MTLDELTALAEQAPRPGEIRRLVKYELRTADKLRLAALLLEENEMYSALQVGQQAVGEMSFRVVKV